MHNGHLTMIETVLRSYDSIIIGIGSSNKSRTYKNPFTFEERKFMIENSLQLKIPFEIVGIPDFGNNEKWIAWIDDNIDFDVFVSNAKNELDIFKEYGFDTKTIKLRDGYLSSTKVRELMIDSKDIKDMVPEVVSKFIDDINLKLVWI